MARLTLEFNEEMDRIIKQLSDEEDVSKRELIRRALALYNYLHREGVRIGGEKNLSITTKDGGIIKDIVF